MMRRLLSTFLVLEMLSRADFSCVSIALREPCQSSLFTLRVLPCLLDKKPCRCDVLACVHIGLGIHDSSFDTRVIRCTNFKKAPFS